MHVLCLSQFFPPDGCEGSGRLHDAIRRLVVSGHVVTVVTGQISYLTGKPFRDYGGRLVVRETDSVGCRVIRLRSIGGYHASLLRRALAFLIFMVMAALVALIQPRPHVVLASSPPPTLGLVGALVGLIRGAPLVYEIRDLWVEDAAALGVVRGGVLLRLLRATERWIESSASILIPVTPGLAARLRNRGTPSEKIMTIPNGVDVERFHPDVDHAAITSRLNLNDRFVVACAGALGYNNDLPVLVDAAERLRDVADVLILVIGDGSERIHAQNEASRRGLRNISFVGWVPKEEVPKYLCAADAAICIALDSPVNHVAYANRAFDAMACGRPLICMIDGLLRELVEASNAGKFASPGSGDALARAVLDLRNVSAAERHAMGQRGRALVQKSFDRRLTSMRLAEVVELAGARKAAPVEETSTAAELS